MKIETKLIRTSRWIDQQKTQCKRWTPQGLQTDSILYTRLCMLQNRVGKLLVRIDKLEKRKFDYR